MFCIGIGMGPKGQYCSYSPVHVKVSDLGNSTDKDRVDRIVKVYPL